MREGLLWYDDDPGRGFREKVALAVVAYRRKFGVMPDVCFVHPSAMNGIEKVGTVQVEALPSVLRHHFWVGVADE